MCNDEKHCKMLKQASDLRDQVIEFVGNKYGVKPLSRSEKEVLDKEPLNKDEKTLSRDDMQVIIVATGMAFAAACADSGLPPELAIPLAIKLIGGAYGADVQMVNSAEMAGFSRMANQPRTIN
jgi:hypothetical protein